MDRWTIAAAPAPDVGSLLMPVTPNGTELRRRREKLNLSIEALALAVPCGISTVQRAERSSPMRGASVIAIESTLTRLEGLEARKNQQLSKRQALMFGAYSGSMFELLPEAPGNHKLIQEFFAFVDDNPIIDEVRFPVIHKWKHSFRKGVKIASKVVIEKYLAEIQTLSDLVGEKAPEHYFLCLFAKHVKLGCVAAVLHQKDTSEQHFGVARIYALRSIPPDLIPSVDRIIAAATDYSSEAYRFFSSLLSVLYSTSF